MNSVRFAICTLLALAFDAAGAPLFRGPSTVDLGKQVFPAGQMVAADFNGDTFPDAAIPHWDGRLAVTFSNATGPFASTQVSTVPEYIFGMAAGDLDGDGDQDLVYVTRTEVGGLLNNGSGAFTHASALYALIDAKLGVGDVNGDGKLDAVVATAPGSYSQAQISVHLGNGSGGFAAGVITPAVYNDMHATGVTVTDLNADGKAEVITSGAQTSVYLGGATGALQFTWTGTGGLVAVGRLNGDVYPDLAIHFTFNYNSSLYTLMGQGDGKFAQQTIRSSPVWNAVKIACVDMDGDQVNDLVTMGGTTAVVRGLGNGTFAEPLITMISVSQYGQFVAADFDRDGKRDLLTASEYAAGVRFHRGQGDGTFRDDRGYLARSVRGTATGVSALDMNGDGRPDATALLGNADSTVDIAVMRNDANGGLLAAVITPTAIPAEHAPRFIAGKLNSDSWPDALVITSGPEGREAHAFFGNGNAGFTRGATTTVLVTEFDQQYAEFKLADVTGDGFNDLLIEGHYYEGNGDGTFDDARAPGVPNTNFSVVGDVDGNGTLDAVWYEAELNSLAIALNTGGGIFAATAYFGTTAARPQVLADFNDDGLVDLVCSIASDPGKLQVFGGKGNGTFHPAVEVLIPRNYWLYEKATSADFDGDGNLDVAFGTDVFLGDGQLRFRSLEFDQPYWRSSGTAVADFDANGSPDVVEFSSNVAYVFLTRLVPEPVRNSATTLEVNPAPEHAAPSAYLAKTTGTGAPIVGSTLYRVGGLPVAISQGSWSSEYATAFAVMNFTLPAGAYEVTAEFLGDATYRPSSASIHATVGRATTSLKQTSYSSMYGMTALVQWELTAPVTAGMQKPPTTGAYVLRKAGVALTDVQWGTNSVSINGLNAGTHTLTLEFLGDSYYKPASVTFQKVITKRGVLPSEEYSPAGRDRLPGPVTMTMKVLPPVNYGTTTGTVEFSIDGQGLGTVPLENHRATIGTGPLAAGRYNVEMRYSGDDNTAPYTYHSILLVYLPTGSLIPVIATAVTNQSVSLTWLPAAEAQNYRLFQRTSFAAAWELAGQITLTLATVYQPPGTTRMYAVAPRRFNGTIGPMGPPDLATTVPFTTTAASGTPIRAADVTELRTAVSAVRTFAGLSAFPFTAAPLPGTNIRALHLTELREALTAARNAIGMPVTFSADGPVAGGAIRAVHIEELRAGVR